MGERFLTEAIAVHGDRLLIPGSARGEPHRLLEVDSHLLQIVHQTPLPLGVTSPDIPVTGTAALVLAPVTLSKDGFVTSVDLTSHEVRTRALRQLNAFQLRFHGDGVVALRGFQGELRGETEISAGHIEPRDRQASHPRTAVRAPPRARLAATTLLTLDMAAKDMHYHLPNLGVVPDIPLTVPVR